MQFSAFGQKFLKESGTLQLMADLGQAASQPGMILLGGGNPAQIPALHDYFRHSMAHIMDSEDRFERMVGAYDGPAGDQALVEALADLFAQEYGWAIGPEHIALTGGSQMAFFFLFNLVAGKFPDGSRRRILLPLAPEYIGYEDVGIDDEDLFVSFRPQIDFLPDRQFKYRVDFDALTITPDIGAICVSRPTNPTGNVLTEREIAHLSRLAQEYGIPLIVDNAYGLPFPGIIFTEAVPTWEPHMIMCMSLSKLGLPGVRTGIVVADPQIIRALVGMNAIISLAPGSIGSALVLDAVRSREILRLSQDVVKPHYAAKSQQAVQRLHQALEGVDYFIHKPEGAIFLWLWLRGLPIPCQELYLRLKARGVLVLAGHHFFPGLADPWTHRHECLRLNYAGDPEMVRRGIEILGEEVKRAYGAG